MLFAVDAHAIGCRLTGNEVYIRNLLTAMADLPGDWQLLAYVSRPEAEGMLPSRFRRARVSPNPFVRLGADLPLRLRRDRPSLLHVQYTAPIACTAPIVVTLRARQAGERWEVEFVLDAAIPGYVIQDRYRSILRPGLCCLELEKQFQHGNKKGRERTSFDAERGIAIRETLGGGGKSEISVPACPRDALGFLLASAARTSTGALACGAAGLLRRSLRGEPRIPRLPDRARQ
jgi:hypothetical protein